MAFVRSIVRDDRMIKGIHPSIVECKYLVAEKDGKKVLQLNTYGSDDRAIPGKLSQTLQFDEAAARDLWVLLLREFKFTDHDDV